MTRKITDTVSMNILDLDLPDWEELVVKHGHKKYRGRQIFDWLHRRLIQNPAEMNNMPAEIKNWLSHEFDLSANNNPVINRSFQDNSEKLLYKTAKSTQVSEKDIELVYLPHRTWNSVCLSTQSGCSLNCRFCASGQIPFGGNLSVSEILYPLYDIIRKKNIRINNIVFMGMGEPFYNYANTMKAARILSRQEGIGIGVKKIAISTSGVLPGIQKFIQNNEPYALALSVHFFEHEKRRTFMDIEEKYPIDEVLQYLIQNKEYFNRKSIMIEYIHIPGVNDSNEEARKLGELGKTLGARINLVAYNGAEINIKEYFLRKPEWSESVQFQNQIKKYTKMVFIRNSAGEDINGACGMLAGSHL